MSNLKRYIGIIEISKSCVVSLVGVPNYVTKDKNALERFKEMKTHIETSSLETCMLSIVKHLNFLKKHNPIEFKIILTAEYFSDQENVSIIELLKEEIKNQGLQKTPYTVKRVSLEEEAFLTLWSLFRLQPSITFYSGPNEYSYKEFSVLKGIHIILRAESILYINYLNEKPSYELIPLDYDAMIKNFLSKRFNTLQRVEQEVEVFITTISNHLNPINSKLDYSYQYLIISGAINIGDYVRAPRQGYYANYSFYNQSLKMLFNLCNAIRDLNLDKLPNNLLQEIKEVFFGYFIQAMQKRVGEVSFIRNNANHRVECFYQIVDDYTNKKTHK